MSLYRKDILFVKIVFQLIIYCLICVYFEMQKQLNFCGKTLFSFEVFQSFFPLIVSFHIQELDKYKSIFSFSFCDEFFILSTLILKYYFYLCYEERILADFSLNTICVYPCFYVYIKLVVKLIPIILTHKVPSRLLPLLICNSFL